ncbi:MAG: hypothetical protein ACE5GY_08560 [Thermodesulfobacteriota bacterium]
MVIDNSISIIIVTAQSFNPSIFTETWLDRHKIISVDSLDGPRVSTPQAAVFQTKEVALAIEPSKMQVSFSTHKTDSDFDTSLKIPLRIVELLPHTPYLALGLNFNVFVKPPEGQDFLSYNKSLLGTGDYKLLREFSVEDARFGRYFSKDYGEARLKLDIKPVKAGPENKDMIAFLFNFHFEVSEVDVSERWKKLVEYIGNWNSFREYATSLVEVGAKL